MHISYLKCEFRMALVSVAVIIGMLIGGVNGGFISICGDVEEQNVCLPTHECKAQVLGQCQSLWCCKNETYSNNPPPGDCICVTDLHYCSQLPFPYAHSGSGANCVCCDCEERCVPLRKYKIGLKLCPTFEKPLGKCDNDNNHFCCPTHDEFDEACDCFQKCPTKWKNIGTCGKCCVF